VNARLTYLCLEAFFVVLNQLRNTATPSAMAKVKMMMMMPCQELELEVENVKASDSDVGRGTSYGPNERALCCLVSRVSCWS
jgi:hypothetical protein